MLKVGDRVKYVGEYGKGRGEEGIVIDVQENYPRPYLIEYTNDIDGHDGGGLSEVVGRDGHCYWETDDTLEKMEDSNILEEVCKMLDVEIGGEWKGNDGLYYCISERGQLIISSKDGELLDYGYMYWKDVLSGELKRA